MVTPETAGEPMRPWQGGRSRLRQRRADGGQAVSAPTVSRLRPPPDEALRVQAQATAAGSPQPDRDMPVHAMAAQQQAGAAASPPIISVGTTKNAWRGAFKNAGQGWGQQAIAVQVHDFPSAALARAVPDGLDAPRRHPGAGEGGTAGDTPALAVTAMAPGWEPTGRGAYPPATPLLSLGAAGGRHGEWPRRWKAPRRSRLSDGLGRRVTGCHEPTGGSTWHPMAPRLGSQLRLKGPGQPGRGDEARRSA
jgi:hypothetical protein